jgi:hypothetical protein
MTKKHLLGVFATFTLLLSSCIKDNCERTITYTKHTPVYLTNNDMRHDAIIEGSKSLQNPGKIYFYNNYIFINELREGIHVIDNSNPSSPQNIAFLAIPGNVDMAVKDNILYADNYMDLLAIDIANPASPTQMSRQQDVFPLLGQDNNGNTLAYYREEEITEVTACNPNGWWNRGGFTVEKGVVFVQNDMNFASSPTGSPTNTTTNSNLPAGIGGSMARFTVVNDYLYTIDNQNMHTFDISNGITPNHVHEQAVGWEIETIFPANNNLFIGSTNGMFIYSIANPSSPAFVSEFAHVGACDPVFVDGDIAYVTLRSGSICQGFNNQLDVIDISNIASPSLMTTYNMLNPHGLSIADNTMFLCEGNFGLKVLDITDPLDINEIEHNEDFKTYDVIALPNDVLLVIGADGFRQYDASDVKNLELLSTIDVN